MPSHLVISVTQPAASGWGTAVIAALVGAGSALLVTLVKDWFLEIRKERRAVLRGEVEVYKQYLAPLCDACEKIVWRSKEIFVDQRHAFLKTSTLPLGFNGYKRTSTLYRIATLIGWIRGMDRELSSLPRRNPAKSPSIAKEVNAFRKALAEGTPVEDERLARLCALWSLDISGLSVSSRAKLAMRVEVKAHELTGLSAAEDLAAAASLNAVKKRKLCVQLAEFIAGELKVVAPEPGLIEANVAEALDSLAFREALIYRDWQDALGDAMIELDEDSPRRFRIIGYAAFEDMIDKKATPWMRVLAASIDDIDLETVDPKDFRSQQLQRLAGASAAILVAASKRNDAHVSPMALGAATALIKALSDRPA